MFSDIFRGKARLIMNRHEKALEILSKGTVIPATPLVLDENKKFDAEGQKFLTEYYLEAGVGGIATAVHSTQFEIRLPEFSLFEPILKTVSETIDEYEKKTGKTIVRVAGVCGKAEQAVSEALIAKKYGYDAVLLSPGGLNDLSEDELLERTEKVAAVMPVIGFYLQKAVGGRYLSYDYWKRFCEIDNVVAVKCASFNRYSTIDVVRAAAFSSRADKITLYTGNDDNIIYDLITNYTFTENGKTVSKKFEGGLLGHWTVWTNNVVKLFERIKSNPDDPELRVLAPQITDANGVIFDAANNFVGCISGIHEILRRQGLIKHIHCLCEHEHLSDGQMEEIDRILRMYPHLTDDEFVKEYIAKKRA